MGTHIQPQTGTEHVSVSTHGGLLVVAGGLLAMALFLEGARVSAPFADFHGHEHFPTVAHAFALISVLLGLWPSLRHIVASAKRLRLDWRAGVIAGVFAALVAQHTMFGAGAAFAFSLGSLIWRKAHTPRDAGGWR